MAASGTGMTASAVLANRKTMLIIGSRKSAATKNGMPRCKRYYSLWAGILWLFGNATSKTKRVLLKRLNHSLIRKMQHVIIKNRLIDSHPLLIDYFARLPEIQRLEPKDITVLDAVSKIVIGQMLSRKAASTIIHR